MKSIAEKTKDYYEGKVNPLGRIGYSLGGSAGGNFVYTTVSSFATLYYTDSVGIAAATAGTMMLIARILDAVSDITMGAIIDKTNSKWGKAKPWFMISIIPLIVSLLLLFNVPSSFGMTGKIVYMYVTYIFSSVIAFTMMNLSHNTMLMLMTGNDKERVFLTATSNIFGFVSIIVINMLTSNLVEKIGWSALALIYGFISFMLLLIEGLTCKEHRHEIEQAEEDGIHKEKIAFSVALKNLLKNRYFFIVIGLSVLNYLGIGATNGIGVYYCINEYHNGGLFGLVTLAGMGPCIVFLPFIAAIAVKLGKRNCLIIGYAAQAIGFGLVYFTQGTLITMIVGLVIKGIGLSFIAALLVPLVGDIIDYGEWKTGVRLDGITQSASSFGTKVGTGIGSAIVGWGLAIGGYNAALEIQSVATINAINMVFAGIPAICSIVGIVLALFFNIEKYAPEIREALQSK